METHLILRKYRRQRKMNFECVLHISSTQSLSKNKPDLGHSIVVALRARSRHTTPPANPQLHDAFRPADRQRG